jgi:histidyl-tRNA synthetase
VGDLTATDAGERMQTPLKDSEAGRAGVEEIGRLLQLAVPEGR